VLDRFCSCSPNQKSQPWPAAFRPANHEVSHVRRLGESRRQAGLKVAQGCQASPPELPELQATNEVSSCIITRLPREDSPLNRWPISPYFNKPSLHVRLLSPALKSSHYSVGESCFNRDSPRGNSGNISNNQPCLLQALEEAFDYQLCTHQSTQQFRQ